MPEDLNLKGRQVLVVASQKVAGKIVTFLEERCSVSNTIQVESLEDALQVLLSRPGITVVCFSEGMRDSKRGGVIYPQALVQMLSGRGKDPRQFLLFWFNPRKGGELSRCKLN